MKLLQRTVPSRIFTAPRLCLVHAHCSDSAHELDDVVGFSTVQPCLGFEHPVGLQGSLDGERQEKRGRGVPHSECATLEGGDRAGRVHLGALFSARCRCGGPVVQPRACRRCCLQEYDVGARISAKASFDSQYRECLAARGSALHGCKSARCPSTAAARRRNQRRRSRRRCPLAALQVLRTS